MELHDPSPQLTSVVQIIDLRLLTGGSIGTTGTGANGAFATGTGSSVALSGVTIKTTADGGHAVMATQAGAMTLNNVTMTTAGGSSSAVATDRGGGTINVTGGTIATSGGNSACIYSTGAITLSGATCNSSGAETAVIEGANSITLNNTALTTTMNNKWAVMIYQSMSGDASGTQGTFTMTGGSLTSTGAASPLFYVNNSTGVISLKGVTLSAASGVLVSAAAGSWGTTGSNGGNVVLTADGQTLGGNMTADSISSISATLKNSSTLTGTLTKAALSLDATSVWNVTGNSTLTTLSDSAGIFGSAITNINGNGYTVTYDASLSGNRSLGGLTYSLNGGGTLVPSGSTSTCTYTLGATSQQFTAAAGTGTVSVTASGTSCAWTAASNAAWIAIASGASGTGSGTVGYQVAADTSTAQRSGTLTIAGQTFTVTQTTGSNSTTFTLSPPSASVPAAGGNVQVTVTAPSSTASWTAASNASWIAIASGASGIGNGTVSLAVSANTSSSQRTGTVTIAGLTFTVTQPAAQASGTPPGPPSGTPPGPPR